MHVSRNPVPQALAKYLPVFTASRQRHLQHHSWLSVETPLMSRYNRATPHATSDTEKTSYEQWLGEFEGLYFLWPASIGVFVPLVVIYLTINALLLHIEPLLVVLIAMVLVAYQSAMWNCMHPMLHGKRQRQLRWYEGIDFIDPEWFETTKLYRWLWKNHVMHHLIPNSKQGNFNVTAPLADHLFGTYHDQTERFIVTPETFTVIPVKASAKLSS